MGSPATNVPIVRLFPPQYPGIAPNTTPEFTAVISDFNGTPISASNITSLTLSIIDTLSGSVVNGVTQVNILNTGRGVVDSSGNLTITLLAADTALFNVLDQREERSLVVQFSFNSGTRTSRFEIRFIIINLSQ